MKWAGYAVALVLLSIVITCSANQASIVVAAVEEGKKPSFGSTGADPFALEPLPYELDALEPYISKETLEYHHGKHLAAYVNNLNGLVRGSELADKSLEELIKTEKGTVFNNAAQVRSNLPQADSNLAIWNHNFYFKSLKKGAEAEPVGILAAMIVEAFGSFKEFQHQFTTEALKHFGSGWVWLVLNSDGKLAIVATHDAANPLQHDLIPLLTCDVWEHAYYIDYRNARPRYLHSWWKLINWDFASANLENASSSSP